VSVPPAAAAPSPAAAPAPAPLLAPTAGLHKLWGTVVSLDGQNLTLKDRHGMQRVLRVASNAALTRGGAQAASSLADLKVGDKVTVRYAADVAASVHINVVPASH
jgi:hypothetical protein